MNTKYSLEIILSTLLKFSKLLLASLLKFQYASLHLSPIAPYSHYISRVALKGNRLFMREELTSHAINY